MGGTRRHAPCVRRCRGQLCTRKMYQERYPNRRLPNRRTFVNVDQHLRETGSLELRMYDTGRNRSVRTPQFEEEILQRFEDNPSTSTRIVARELRVNSCLVWNVVHDNALHPFYRQKVQALGPNDFPARLAFGFCNKEPSNLNFQLLFCLPKQASRVASLKFTTVTCGLKIIHMPLSFMVTKNVLR